MVVKYEVDPDKEFDKAVKDAAKQVADLTIPLTLITQSWFKSNRAFFDLKGPGKFADLSDNYKKRKKASVGFIYPILKRAGALEASITNPGDGYAISEIVNKTAVILGTKIPYAAPLQFGTKNIPARPFVMIGAEQTGPPEFNKRKQEWIELIGKYVLDQSKELGTVTP